MPEIVTPSQREQTSRPMQDIPERRGILRFYGGLLRHGFLNFRSATGWASSLINLGLVVLGLLAGFAPDAMAGLLRGIIPPGEPATVERLARTIQSLFWVPLLIALVASMARRNYEQYEGMRSAAQNLRQTVTSHDGAPLLAWLYPRAEMFADGRVAVDVYCENAGPAESEAVIVDTFSDPNERGEAFYVPIEQWSRVLSRKLGDQHRFKVMIRSAEPRSPPLLGEREVKWGAIYLDGSNRDKVYVTAASIKAEFQAIGPAEITEQWMDATSTKAERHKRWLDHKNPFKKAGT